VREETKENEIKRKEKLAGTVKTQTSMKDTMKTIKEGKVWMLIIHLLLNYEKINDWWLNF